MSNYVYGSSLSWNDYLQAKSFVDDISSSSREAGHRVLMEISHQTREIIASNEALSRENIRMMEASTDRIERELGQIDSTLNAGFDRLSYDIQEISSGISELNSNFHWGFGQLIAGIGHMNDALSELIKIAKTPVQTVAFNHFEIARDAFRKGLMQESLEELDKAIKGDHTSPGYKLEWRFHQMVGTIRLGFADCELSLIDLKHAEESFLQAARYAKTDYPDDAARAFLSAGWAAYCQGKMKEALTHTEQALALRPKLGEALFQVAKVRMALGEVGKALPVLEKAIDLDRFFALKAAGDGDFQKYEDSLKAFFRALRAEKYRALTEKVEASLDAAKPWLSRNIPGDQALACRVFLRFFLKNENIPLVDLMNPANEVHKNVAELETWNARWNEIERQRTAAHQTATSLLKTFSFWAEHSPDAKPLKEYLSESMNWPVTKLYDFYTTIKVFFDHAEKKASKSICILYGKPFDVEITIQTRSLFRKADVLIVKMIRDEIYSGKGEPLTVIEFCHIPAGHFMMGERNDQHQVSITKDFYLGKYPVTQAQWQAVMGNNPSHFKGDLSLPVEQVSWNDCQAFCMKLNQQAGLELYRLPTEAEWEYACRAGSNTDYCFGDEAKKLREYGWYVDNLGNRTHSVGQLKPNSWGVYDVHGNVYEWCLDRYEEEYFDECKKKGSVENPTGPETGSARVLRGGCWIDIAWFCRCARRHSFNPDNRNSHIGFRLVFVP